MVKLAARGKNPQAALDARPLWEQARVERVRENLFAEAYSGLFGRETLNVAIHVPMSVRASTALTFSISARFEKRFGGPAQASMIGEVSDVVASARDQTLGAVLTRLKRAFAEHFQAKSFQMDGVINADDITVVERSFELIHG